MVVIDLTEAHRLETSVSQYLERQGREIAVQSYPAPLVLAGVIQNSGVHADLKRGGVACHWVDYAAHDSPDVNGASPEVVSGMPTFDSLRAALQWTRTRIGGKLNHFLAFSRIAEKRVADCSRRNSDFRSNDYKHFLLSPRSRFGGFTFFEPYRFDILTPGAFAGSRYSRPTTSCWGHLS